MHQLAETHFLEHAAEVLVAEALRIEGITELLAQAAQDHVGLLGNEQQLGDRRTLHITGGGGPEAAHQAQQRGLAAAARPHHQHALFRTHLKAQVVDQASLAAGGNQIHMPHQDRRGRTVVGLPGPLCRRDRLHLALEALQTADRGGEGGELIDVVHDVTHREQHLREGDAGLSEHTEVHLLGEVDRCDHQPGQETREVVVRALDHADHRLPDDQPVVVANRTIKAAVRLA